MSSKKIDMLQVRATIELAMTSWFNFRGFTKVSTPILMASHGGAVATPFRTRSQHNGDLTLRIAPELELKKLIAAGMEKVYEIGPSFRNEGMIP